MGTTWPVTIQLNSIRMAASSCVTEDGIMREIGLQVQGAATLDFAAQRGFRGVDFEHLDGRSGATESPPAWIGLLDASPRCAGLV